MLYVSELGLGVALVVLVVIVIRSGWGGYGPMLTLVGGFLVWLLVYRRRHARITVDEHYVHVTDAGGAHTMVPRSVATGIRYGGRNERLLEVSQGEHLSLSSEYLDDQYDQLAEVLGVPIIDRTGYLDSRGLSKRRSPDGDA
jgi:hypothetical protein